MTAITNNHKKILKKECSKFLYADHSATSVNIRVTGITFTVQHFE
nr:MAG TPA: hypothetical protein [Caudoviricetes sp.]